jgi:hypothetical protein
LREEAGLLHHAAANEVRWRSSQTPASDFPEMVAALVRNPKGDGRGGYGLDKEGFKGGGGALLGE